MTRARIISTLILTGFLLLTVNSKSIVAQIVPTIDVDVQVLDRYTRNELDSVSVALFFDGVLLDSTVTSADGRALFRISVTSLEQPAELPAELSLSPNYPNPFNSDTRVDLGVPEAQSVRIEVFNVIGQRVAVQSLNLDAGRYALNLSMGHLPVGVYFLRVSGRESRVEKMAKLGKGFMSQGAMFRMESAGGYHQSQPVVARQSGGDYLSNTVDDNESGYRLRAERNRYRDFVSEPEIQGNTELLVEMRRENIVSLIVINDQDQAISRVIEVSGEQFSTTLSTPDTLVLDSGIFKIRAIDSPDPGTPADFMVDALIEVISKDSSYTISPFIPHEAVISGRVANEFEIFLSAVQVQFYRDGSFYGSTTTNSDGEYNFEVLANGSMYSIVVAPEIFLNGSHISDDFTGFTTQTKVLTPEPGGEYEIDFLLYTESPLSIPGGDGTLPIGPYTLASSDGTVSIANIPPDLGISGGTARVFSPNITPDAFPGEFATRQAGFESGLISGGFASVNLYRQNGANGLEPVSELRDSTGAPVQVLLRFRMDPLDYEVVREPATLSHLPGFVNRPDTIDVPLYYFNEQLGDWILASSSGWLENERGAIHPIELVNIQNGEYKDDIYVAGYVDHFSWYNLDFPESLACLTGRIVDQNNRPVKNATLKLRSIPAQVARSFFSNIRSVYTDTQGYFEYSGPRSERNSGDDWNENNRIDTFHVMGEYSDKDACGIAEFDNNGSGYRMPQFPVSDGCGNIGTIRVSLREATKGKFPIVFTDIERNGQPGRPLFVDPRSATGLNYAFASLSDLRIPLMGEVWNCACDNESGFSSCNRQSTLNDEGKAVFTIPVVKRDKNHPIQREEKLTGLFSYRKMRPDLGAGAHEFAVCAFLVDTVPPKDEDPPIHVECEVKLRGVPTIEIIRIEGELANAANPRDFLFDEGVTVEATGTDLNGDSIDEMDMFYWTNDLETLFIASGRIATRPANVLFGTGSDQSIRAHGINYFGLKGDTIESGISVEEVTIEAFANRNVMVPGDTAIGTAVITGAVNTTARWESMTPTIASASASGTIIGRQPGTAIIRAQSLADMRKTATTEIVIVNLFAEFNVDPAAGDSLTEFFFDATESVGEITQYDWDFGDGNSAAGQTISHIYGVSGVYTVTLSVTGPMGLQATKSRTVSATGRSLAVIAADPVVGTAPLNVFFDGRGSSSPSGNITGYSWNFGDGGTAEGDTVSHEYSSPGVFNATLTISDASNSTSTDSVVITVVSPPVASFTVTPESGQPPLQVSVDASGSTAGEGTIIKYSWDFGDGLVIEDGDSTATHLYTESGSFTITLTIETSLGLLAHAEQIVDVGCETFEGNISITSVDQLTQFQNVCRVVGNVTISGLSGLVTLPEFFNLIEITGNLTIRNTPNLQNIHGFNRLRSVRNLHINANQNLLEVTGFRDLISAREINFGNNFNLFQLPQFENLREVTVSLAIVGSSIIELRGFGNLESARLIGLGDNSNLLSIDAFNSLETVDRIFIQSNSSLTELNGFENLNLINNEVEIRQNPLINSLNIFQNLNRVTGTFRFTDSQVSACDILDIVQRVQLAGGITGTVTLQNHPGIVNSAFLSTEAQIDAFAGTCMVTTLLTVSTTAPSLSGLKDLRFASQITISDSPNLTDLSGLENLVHVPTFLIIRNNNLSALSGLDRLQIVSNLTIEGNNSLTDLTGPERLEVLNSLSLNNNPILSDLSALSNLRRVNNLSLRIMPLLTNLTGLDNLKHINSLSLQLLPELTAIDVLAELDQMPETIAILSTGLERIPAFIQESSSPVQLSLTIENNPELNDISGLHVIENLRLLRVVNNAALQSLNGLHNVKQIGSEGAVLTDNSSLESLVGMGGLEMITGGLFLTNNALTDLTGLENLTRLETLRIENSPFLQNLNALSGLNRASRIILQNVGIQNVNGLSNLQGNLMNLNLNNLPQLENLNGLDGIIQIRNQLAITHNPNLLNLNGLQNLTHVGLNDISAELLIVNNLKLENINGLSGLTQAGKIIIQDNPALVSLDGLNNLIGNIHSIRIQGMNQLVNIDAFSGINDVLSAILIQDNPVLKNLNGLSGITGSVGQIHLDQNPELESISGMSGITEVNDLRVDNSALTNVNGLNNITRVTTLTLRNNPLLEHFDDLNSLSLISSQLVVNNNASLKKVSGLTALARVNSSFTVVNNSSLPLCDIQILIDQIQDRNGIGGNISTTGNDSDGVCQPSS